MTFRRVSFGNRAPARCTPGEIVDEADVHGVAGVRTESYSIFVCCASHGLITLDREVFEQITAGDVLRVALEKAPRPDGRCEIPKILRYLLETAAATMVSIRRTSPRSQFPWSKRRRPDRD